MTTKFFAFRDTNSNNADDETRAMCHVDVYSGDDAADAAYQLQQKMIAEAAYLVKGRDITNQRDVWAFKRAIEMIEGAEEFIAADAPTPGNDVVIITDGIRWTLRAVVQASRVSRAAEWA